MEKQKLNTSVVYILSGLGLVCCCIGGVGFIPAGIAFFLAHNKLNEYKVHPEDFESPTGMQTAKTVAMVVLILNVAYLVYTIYMISTVGWDELMEQSQMMMEEWEMQQAE